MWCLCILNNLIANKDSEADLEREQWVVGHNPLLQTHIS